MKKRNLIFILIGVLIISCTKRSYIPEETYYSVDFDDSQTVVTKPKADKKDNKSTDNAAKTNIGKNDQGFMKSAIEYSKKFIGTPYKYGGTTPSGFDCSGYIMYVFKEFGVDLPRNAIEMAKAVDKIDIKNVQAGDLIFFKGSNAKSNEIGHVALVTEKTASSFKMIHATSSKGVIINDFDQYEYWVTRFLFAGRIKSEILNNRK